MNDVRRTRERRHVNMRRRVLGSCYHEFQKRAGRNIQRSPKAVLADLLPQQSVPQPLSRVRRDGEDLDKRALERTVRRDAGWKARHLTIQRDLPLGKNLYTSGLASGDEFVNLSKSAGKKTPALPNILFEPAAIRRSTPW